jgi:hypothetical protein
MSQTSPFYVGRVMLQFLCLVDSERERKTLNTALRKILLFFRQTRSLLAFYFSTHLLPPTLHEIPFAIFSIGLMGFDLEYCISITFSRARLDKKIATGKD